MASGPVPRNLIRETKLTLVCSASLDPFITGVCDWGMAGGCEFAFWLLTVKLTFPGTRSQLLIYFNYSLLMDGILRLEPSWRYLYLKAE